MDRYQATAKIFKALMHPGRLAILHALQDGEQCVCHLEAVLGCRQAYISQHLAILREAGLVEDHRDGWNIFYRVCEEQVYQLIDAAGALAGQPPLSAQPLEKPADCPCPKCNKATALAETPHSSSADSPSP